MEYVEVRNFYQHHNMIINRLLT